MKTTLLLVSCFSRHLVWGIILAAVWWLYPETTVAVFGTALAVLSLLSILELRLSDLELRLSETKIRASFLELASEFLARASVIAAAAAVVNLLVVHVLGAPMVNTASNTLIPVAGLFSLLWLITKVAYFVSLPKTQTGMAELWKRVSRRDVAPFLVGSISLAITGIGMLLIMTYVPMQGPRTIGSHMFIAIYILVSGVAFVIAGVFLNVAWTRAKRLPLASATKPYPNSQNTHSYSP